MERLNIGERGEIHTPFRLESGKYRARVKYRGKDGKVRELTATGPTKGRAKSALNQKWRKKSQTLLSGNSDILTVEQMMWDWFASATKPRANKKPWMKSTAYKYEKAIEHHIVPEIGGLLLSELTTGRINDVLDSLVDEDGNGYTNAKRARTVFTDSCQWAVGRELMGANPARDVMPVSKPKREVDTFTMEELTALRDAIARWCVPSADRPGPSSQRTIDVFELMLATGARISEPLALYWPDVHIDPEPGVTYTDENPFVPWVYIHRSVHEDPDGHLWIGATKEKDKRAVALPEFGVQVLRRRRIETGGVERVFDNREGGIVRPEYIRRSIRSALSKADLDPRLVERFKPHTIRKTIATLVDKHLGSLAAAKQLGHRDDRVTKQHYIAIDPTIVDHATLIEQFAAGGAARPAALS